MRSAFINKLTEMARKDHDIFLLTADLGFSVFEKFEEEFQERFINVGICESAMVGIAAGLAMSGKKVYIYSIIPFITMRAFEHVRVDLCYQNLNVNLVGGGGGFGYGSAGVTHHAIEDISIMRSLPNMTVICPGDPFEAYSAVEQVANMKGPSYIRLSKNNEPLIHNITGTDFLIGKAIRMKEGNDLSIISTGNMLEQALMITSKLKALGYKVKLISMHTIKPIDVDAVLESIRDTKAIFTLEEHSVIGGLGSAVAEIIVKNMHKHIFFKSYGVPDIYADCSGSGEYFRKKYEIDEESVLSNIKRLMTSINK